MPESDSVVQISSEDDATSSFPKSKASNLRVAVLGSGLYGQAIARRIRYSDMFDVNVGSRTPSDTKVSYTEAVKNADIVLLAVPAWTHSDVMDTIRNSLRRNTIVVDISNQPLAVRYKQRPVSNAELLQNFAPSTVHIVKAFNTVSTYDFDTIPPTKSVPVVHMASDSDEAMETLTVLVRGIGMMPIKYGNLAAAVDLERMSHRLFPRWKLTVCFSAVVWGWWLLYTTISYFIYEQLILEIFNICL